MHCNMYSCVMYKGHLSDWFPVLQGTRQGGVGSPFLYLMYIDSLIEQLVSSNLGFQIEWFSLCVPSFADDMTLLCLSSKALQEMISICYRYACLWRYQYNPDKCAVTQIKSQYIASPLLIEPSLEFKEQFISSPLRIEASLDFKEQYIASPLRIEPSLEFKADLLLAHCVSSHQSNSRKDLLLAYCVSSHHSN